VKVIQRQLFVGGQRKFSLVKMEGIHKMFPEDEFAFLWFKASGLPIHAAFQNIITDFLEIVSGIH